MTFKGMLKILVNDFKKQHEEKMVSVVDELMKTRRELREMQQQLHTLQLGSSPLPSDELSMSVPTISLFVQYNGFFNELCDIRQTMTIEELLIKIRQITGISLDHPIHLRVLSEDGLTTICFLDKNLDRTVGSYDDQLKPRMILSIEDDDDEINNKKEQSQRSIRITNSERTHSYESDV